MPQTDVGVMDGGRCEVVEAIASAMQAVGRARALARPEPWLALDLTLPQLKALFVLGALGPSRAGTIAEAIGVTATGATGVLDRLEERGLVRRRADPGDRRALVVELQPPGRALLDEIHAAGREQLVEVLERMGEDDLRALHRGMAALAQAMGTVGTDVSGAPPAADRATDREAVAHG